MVATSKSGVDNYSYFGIEYPEDERELAMLYAKMIAMGDAFAEYPLVYDRLMMLLRMRTFDKDVYRAVIEANDERLNIFLAVTGPKAAVEAFLERETLSDDIVAGLLQNRNLEDRNVLKKYIRSDTPRSEANLRKIEGHESTA